MPTHPYATLDYPRAAAGVDIEVLPVPEWGGFVLTRPIPNTPRRDAVGVYPLTPLPPGADLVAGLDRLTRAALVSVVLVPDPLHSPEPENLIKAFPVCRPFKTHHVIDRRAGPFAPSRHHRHEIRRAERLCEVGVSPLGEVLSEWCALYDNLIHRHGVVGPAAFGSAAFTTLAAEPALTAFVARQGGVPIAMSLWLEHGDVAILHLSAANEAGYAAGAAYALQAAAEAHFSNITQLNLGAGAGLADDPNDGLARFKRGFANNQVTAYLCGAVLDPIAYAALAPFEGSDYFPAYRG